jgi:hypothetical protein
VGYSARYHAVSLAAVFLALGVGILIGVGFGDKVASRTQRNLESSLSGDLKEARAQSDQLRAQTRRQTIFEEQIYPPLVHNRLAGKRIGVIAVGGLPDGIATDLRTALEPSGGRLLGVSVVRVPLDVNSLKAALKDGPLAKLSGEGNAMVELGRRVGHQLINGGALVRRLRSRLLSRASGRTGGIDAAVLVRQRPETLKPGQKQAVDRFERGFFRGIRETDVTAVGADLSGSQHSSISFFKERGFSSVDSVDLVSGRVALVFALAGAEGAFGVNPSADQLLPEPLVP